MANVFLKVNKDLFSMGLNPTEILILAQIMEFNTNTGDCFISDKQLAEQFGVSESTISREIKKLETMGFIARETKNVKGGRERHIKITTGKMKVVEEDSKNTTSKMPIVQESNCLLTTSKLPIDNKQNDFIKDNIKEKEKDNLKEIPEEEGKRGTIQNPHTVSKDWLIERYNELTHLANGLYMYGNSFYKMEVLPQ